MNIFKSKYGNFKVAIYSNASYYNSLRDLQSSYFRVTEMDNQIELFKKETTLNLHLHNDVVINGKTYKGLQISIEQRQDNLFVWITCPEYGACLTNAARIKLETELAELCKQFYKDHFENIKARELTSFLIRYRENLELIKANVDTALKWAFIKINLS